MDVNDENGEIMIYVDARLKPEEQVTPQEIVIPDEPISIKTGDKVLVYIALAITAIIVGTVVFFIKRKKEKDNN